jgi:outer membrane protein
LFNEEIADISRQQTEITKLQVVRIEKMVASGSLPKGSLLELQAQLADEELQMVNAENQVKLAHLDLLQLLQKEGDTELEILKPTFDSVQLAMEIKPASEVYKTSMTLMPQIKSAELKLQSSEKNLSLSRSNRSPTISFGGNLGTGYSQAIPSDYFSQMNDNAYRNFGLTLFVPIFSKYSIQQSINQAKLQMQRANYSLMLEKNNLRQNVEKAWADAEASLKSYYANKKSLEALQESFKYAEKRFEAGMINSVEYNTNKNNLRRAESELTQSKYEYIFKRKILDFFQGIEISF